MRTVSLRPASVSKFASISNGIALGVVVVKNSGNIRGNITAPRVTLEDGAKLKGSIDMEPVDTGVNALPKNGVSISEESIEKRSSGTIDNKKTQPALPSVQ